jgi:alkyl hydroperoxide reductase subunit F
LSTEVSGDGKKVNGLVYTDRSSGQVPSASTSKGSLSRSACCRTAIGSRARSPSPPRGEIEIDARGETSLTWRVFAAGDVTTVPYKQIVIAMGEGSKAALSAFDYLIRSSIA